MSLANRQSGCRMQFGPDGREKLYLIEPDPSAFKLLATAELLGAGNRNGAPIALVDGKLLIRDQKQLKCLTVAQ